MRFPIAFLMLLGAVIHQMAAGTLLARDFLTNCALSLFRHDDGQVICFEGNHTSNFSRFFFLLQPLFNTENAIN